MGAESEATSDPSTAPRAADLHLAETSGSYELVLSAVIFGVVGYFVDQRFGTTPAFLLVFSFAGLIGASASLYYRYKYRIEQLRAETESLRAAADRGGK